MTEEKYFFDKNVYSKKGYKFRFNPDETIIAEILEYKKSGELLDLGCGEGGTAIELAKRGFEVTCIDISDTAIRKIREKALKENIRINALCEDLENFNIDDYYDIIIGTGIFHFLSKDKAIGLIQKAKDKTRKGGINLFEVFLEGYPTQEEDSEGHYFKKDELKIIYSKWIIKAYEEYEDFDEEEGWSNKLARITAVKP